MVKRRKKTVETLKLDVRVIKDDISNGECRRATRCMEKVAIARSLSKAFPDESPQKFHVRVDAGHIRFNVDGYRWQADTPKIAKAALIKFDHKLSVLPHNYTIVATRGGKITPMTAERQKQINMARAERIKQGRPDASYKDLTLRQRIIGFDLGRV
jgi:hypothetical protein